VKPTIVTRVSLSCDVKVTELGDAVGHHKDVLGLDVAVHDAHAEAARVSKRQRFRKQFEVPQDLAQCSSRLLESCMRMARQIKDRMCQSPEAKKSELIKPRGQTKKSKKKESKGCELL
jgi:hypothetical protein